MFRNLIFGIKSIVCACLLFTAIPAFAAAGPEESVRMLQRAIDTNDMRLVETYLDVDAVLEKGVEAAMRNEAVMREAGQYPPLMVLLALGGTSGGQDAIRNLLSSEVKEYVRHGVVSGAFAGKPKEDASVYRGMFTKAFRGGNKDKRSFGKATVKSMDASTARIATTLVEGRKNRSYPLDLVAKQENGVWRIVEVANITDLLNLGAAKGSQ